MKNILRISFTLFLFFALTISINASTNTYSISALDLSIEIPTDYHVITRDTDSNDPIFDDLELSKNDVLAQFESSNIYLNAFDSSFNEEFVVIMTEIYLNDFNLLSDTTLSTLASTWVSEYENFGLFISNYEIYQHRQAKFVKIYFTDAAQTVHGLQYYTVYNSQALNFTLRSYTGSLSTTQEKNIKSIVDRIHFNTAPQKKDPTERTPSFIYADPDTSVNFAVPENWSQEPFSKDREFLDVKFVSNEEEGLSILYGSSDLWSMLSDSEKQGYKRSDFNTSIYTKYDIAEMIGTSGSNVQKIMYNNIPYFQVTVENNTELYGYNFSITVTHAIHIDNGWMYHFQFSGDSSSEYFSDFKSLLNTVNYPKVAFDTINSNTTTNTEIKIEDSALDKKPSYGPWWILTIIITIFLGAVILVINKKLTRLKKTPTTTVKYCHNCGTQLPIDSEYCHNCGTRAYKE